MCDCQDNITLPVGQDGVSAYVYVGYASDNAGTGFSTTPSNSLDYISVKSTSSPQTNNAGLHAGNWAKYQGDDGTNGNDFTPILYNSFVGTSTTSGSFTQLDTFTVAANTLEDNGDTLDVFAFVDTAAVTQQKALEFRIGGTHFTSKITSFLIDINDKSIVLKAKVSRVSATSIRVVLETKASNENHFETHSTLVFDDATVSNLTSNSLVIAVFGKNIDISPSEAITIRQFLIQKSKIV